ncbi:hypothetical protein TcBrA4_0131630 [Trypanosoma cruzi]|nr:hypothetical protein TcBrA4_0131630 [Trypanosoma cruzi]
MAEDKKTEATAALSSSSSSTSGAERRKPLEDVILSPELTHCPLTPKLYLVGGGEHAEARKTRLRSQGATLQHKKRTDQKLTKRLLKARGIKRKDEDDMTRHRVTEKAAISSSATSSEKQAESSVISERDSLLERLREKERQFDEKITALDETLSCAERGRLQRDSIIDDLRAEVTRLRAQLELAAGAKSQADELREKILKERTVALEEAHAKIEALHDTVREKNQRIKHLERELKLRQAAIAAQPQQKLAVTTTAERVKVPQLQKQEEQKQGMLRTLSPNVVSLEERERERRKREQYSANLRALQEEVQALEQRYSITRNEKNALDDENYALRSKLEAIQEEIETRVAGAVKAMQSHVDQKRELEAEVLATRLGMARLLRLLSEVPEMRRYLRVTAIDDDMLFTGYTLAAVTSDRKAISENAGHPHYQRRRNGGFSTLAVGTGVDDGVYGGSLMPWSSNIYLNGKWYRKLQEIIDDENNFLRSRKICIGDLEDAARCGRGGGDGPPRLPPASDVLKGRQNDKDFWIPYAVFVEAQKFKNRYFPALSYECFYPFLIAVNHVWNEKTKRRVAIETRRRLYLQQQKQEQEKRHRAAKEQTDDVLHSNDCLRQMSSSALSFQQQLQQLRHEVRRRVTGKNSLELFHAYDYLIKCALKHLLEVQEEHAALLKRHQYSLRSVCASKEEHIDVEDRERMINEEGGVGIVDFGNEAFVLLRRALSALAEEVQEISERSASRIEASCRDMQEFLGALRDQKLRAISFQEQQQQRLGEGDSAVLLRTQTLDSVPVSTLLRVIEGVLDFVDEVQREVLVARNAMSRCATQADEKSELLFTPAAVDDGIGAEYDEEEDELEMAMDA